MLLVLNRYKIFLIILTIILLSVLLWLFISGQEKDKTPSRGVFVQVYEHECEQGYLLESALIEGRVI